MIPENCKEIMKINKNFMRIEVNGNQSFHGQNQTRYNQDAMKFRLQDGKGTLSFLLVAAGVCTLLPACTTGETPIPTPSERDIATEEAIVYATLFDEIYGEPRMYVLMDTTSPGIEGVEGLDEITRSLFPQLSGLDPDTGESFQSRNKSAIPLAPDMELGLPYILLTPTEFDRIFAVNTSGWDVFYTRYPNSPGMTTISKVGFNPDLSQALVYAATISNWLAGAGHYYLLERSSGTWEIIQQILAWIS